MPIAPGCAEPYPGLRGLGSKRQSPGFRTGVSASFRRYLDDGYTIIVLSNLSGGAIEPADTLEAIVFGRDYPRPRRDVAEIVYRAIQEGGVEGARAEIESLAGEGYPVESSGPLNFLGYQLLGDGELDLAIGVFELNVSLFPEEANPYDSLAEAYLRAGDREASIKNYAKALEVDPGFVNARQALERLKAEE